MSSRQLKKLRVQEEQRLLAEKAAAEARDTESDEEEDDDEAAVEAPLRPKNAFAAFAALDAGNDDVEEDDEDEDGDNKGDGEAQDEADTQRPPKPSKKKKKKKKGKGKPTEPTAGADEATVSLAGKGGKSAADLDDIDRALEELKLKEAAKPSAAGLSSSPTLPPPRNIKVNFHDLRVMNELRDVFGRDTIQAAQAGDDRHGGPPRGERVEGNPGMVMVDLETFLRADPPPPPGMVRIGGGRSTGKEIADVVARRNPFVQWKDTWPRATSGGLSMREVKAETGGQSHAAGIVEYAYVHSPAYVQLEDMFFTLVMMHNHHPLIQFLKQHPYHISSLIQISRVAKQQDQNAALAADLCERALFSFGRATLSSFRQKLAEGKARLSFRRPENRQFLLAGYYYIRSLIPRGTYRTALAWTKLFLSTMPEDDYGLLLYAHVLAVRAFEARWLIDLLGQAGNRSFEPLDANPMRDYIRQSLVPARLQVKDVDGARAALTEGMKALPWLYGALFQVLGRDVPRAVWGIQPRDEAETLYTQLYVHLAKDIWDTAQATALLQEVAAAMVTKPDQSRLPPAEPVTLSIGRFVYLDGTPSLMTLAPRDMLHASPNYDFDPLPPPREENLFSNPSQVRPWLMAQDNHHIQMPALPDDFFLPRRPAGNDDESDSDGFEIEEVEDDDSEGEALQEDGAEHAQDEEERAHPRRNNGGMPGAWYEDDE